MNALEGRRIAVAGAGGSLGPHVVAALKDQGAWVAAGDVREEAFDGLDADDATIIDLSTQAGAHGWADALGDIDGLLHLVGGWRGGAALEDTSPEDLAWLDALLFRTVVHATRAFAPSIKAAGTAGRFAIVSSTAAAAPSPGNAAYAAAKAAVTHLTTTLAVELGPAGIRVNAVAPGTTLTDSVRAAFDDAHVDAIVQSTPLRRMVDPDELGRLAVFLASDLARCITGQLILADAGAFLSRTRPPAPGATGPSPGASPSS